MRKWVFLGVCLLLWTGIRAQEASTGKGNGKVTGKIMESGTITPLEYATITVFDRLSGKTITGTTSDKAGQFSLTGLGPGDYRLVIEFIGFKPLEIPAVQVRKNETVDIKTIKLNRDQQNLTPVTVTAQTKLIESKIDKLVFNAGKDLTSQGGVATDLLRKVPQVSVDVDGNVQLAGNSSIRFLINGKPSTAFGSSVTDVLQSIPASQIKSIEVITNPGARYDAQGLGGIINIILKQNTARGINGNLSLTAGTRMENGSFNFNARNKNFGVNAFISSNARLTVATPTPACVNQLTHPAKAKEYWARMEVPTSKDMVLNLVLAWTGLTKNKTILPLLLIITYLATTTTGRSINRRQPPIMWVIY
ncbi:TonB-dependent receptor [Paraflavitalea speifideaquila]|uniref:TonB-dependent receptor n=1 Tax=Paraflavitalea speifideaquila TaxID=3076558 RepID=UPI0028E57C9C|nr:TonB-dependent receptor [Paraflavitalea speifideiaquila]